MNEFLSRLSSYNVFNYLLPGAIFSIIAERIALISYPSEIIAQFIWYYFVGMVISRVGSILVEPALKFIRFVEYSDYPSYLLACQNDDRLDVMVEVSNTYRTLATVFLTLIVVSVYQWIAGKAGISDAWQERFTITFLLVLFLLSFRKQVNFIRKRVSHAGVAK